MKTSELTGNALNYAVAIAKGIPAEELMLPQYKGDGLWRYLRDEEGNLNGRYQTGPDLLFSSKWEAGGPISEREKIESYWRHPESVWVAANNQNLRYDEQGEFIDGSDYKMTGATELEAKMRCYVASKLGPEIDIPEELA